MHFGSCTWVPILGIFLCYEDDTCSLWRDVCKTDLVFHLSPISFFSTSSPYNNNKLSSSFKNLLLWLPHDFQRIRSRNTEPKAIYFSLILILIIMMIIDHVIFLFRWYRCQRFRFFVFFNHLLLFIVSVDSLSLCLNWNDHLALFLNRYSSTLFSFHRLFILNGNVLNSLWIDLADILSYQISSFSSSISDWFHEW